MPSSAAITPAVSRMIAGDHHGPYPGTFRARHRLSGLVARRIDHADQPREHQVVLDPLVDVVDFKRSGGKRTIRDARASVARGRPARRWSRKDLRRRARSAGAAPSPTSSCVHRVSSTSGAPLVKTSMRSLCSASVCTVLISLRSDENGTSPTRRKRASSASDRSPALRAATISAPSVGSPWTVHCPSALLERRVVGAIGDGERAIQLDPERARRPRHLLRRRTSPCGA